MFEPKIKVPKSLYDKLRLAAQMVGAASIEEFVIQILTAETDKVLLSGPRKEASEDEVKDIAEKLKGLGYIE